VTFVWPGDLTLTFWPRYSTYST